MFSFPWRNRERQSAIKNRTREYAVEPKQANCPKQHLAAFLPCAYGSGAQLELSTTGRPTQLEPWHFAGKYPTHLLVQSCSPHKKSAVRTLQVKHFAKLQTDQLQPFSLCIVPVCFHGKEATQVSQVPRQKA
jgi:hypothetical protein